jgi:predicted GNAT family acetyltransferase
MKPKFDKYYDCYVAKNSWYDAYIENRGYDIEYIKDPISNPLEETKVSVVPFLGESIEDSELKIVLNIVMDSLHRKVDSNGYHTVDIDSMLKDAIYAGRIFKNDTQIGTIEKYRHSDGMTSFNTIAIDAEHRKKGFGYRCIKMFLQNAKEHQSNRFMICGILSKKDGLQFKDNADIFRKIAEKLKGIHEIASFEFTQSEICSRTNLILLF